jgi:hypothetical protein
MGMLLRDSFAYPDGVITNEFATHNPGKHGIHTSAIWLATSGTLFAKNGQGLSGHPPQPQEAGHRFGQGE